MRTSTIVSTSLDTETREGKIKVKQLINGTAIKTSELDGKVFAIVDFIHYNQKETDDVTGEVIKNDNVLCLLDKDDNITGTISNTFIDKMIDYLTDFPPTKEEPLLIIPRFGHQKSKAGRDFLDVDLVI